MYSTRASTRPHRRSPDVFHSVEIEGFHFTGVMRGSDAALVSGGWVQLGPQAVLCQTPTGMQVCKYSAREERINVSELSAAGVETLAHEFGLSGSFQGCPAYLSLVDWAKAHPRKAEKAGMNYWLGPWLDEAKGKAA